MSEDHCTILQYLSDSKNNCNLSSHAERLQFTLIIALPQHSYMLAVEAAAEEDDDYLHKGDLEAITIPALKHLPHGGVSVRRF